MHIIYLFIILQGPSNDGSCILPKNDNELACLSRKSMFDSSISYCSWVPSQTDPTIYYCTYIQPTFTWKMIVVSAVVVAMFTALFNVPLDFMFALLFAPTADDLKIKNDENTVTNKVGRGVANAATAVGNTVRRASLMISNGAAAALRKRREAKIGELTRHIPDVTNEAHSLATQTLSYVAPMLQKNELDREKGKQELCYKTNMITKSEIPLPETLSTLPTTEISMTLYKSLCQDILLQRQLLKPSELIVFDAQWSIISDESNEMNNYRVEPLLSYHECTNKKLKNIMSPVELTILKEVYHTQFQCKEKADKLQYANDSHIGLEILHSFILDLLGRDTPAAKIFNSKSEEDFNYAFIVSKSIKILIMGLVILLNIFFIYFALLRSYQRGFQFQRSYVAACAIQFFVEIFLFETMECLCINFIIPNLISEQVSGISNSLCKTIDNILNNNREMDQLNAKMLSRYVLDVPEYLFVSSNLAKLYPQLLESLIVKAYHTYLPGELAKKWDSHNIHAGTNYYSNMLTNYQQSTNNTSKFVIMRFAIFNFFMRVALMYGASPIMAQKIIINLLQPLILASIAAIAIMLYNNKIAFSMIVTVCGIGCLYQLYKQYMHPTAVSDETSKPKGSTGAVLPVHTNTNDDEFIALDIIDEEVSEEERSDVRSSDQSEHTHGNANATERSKREEYLHASISLDESSASSYRSRAWSNAVAEPNALLNPVNPSEMIIPESSISSHSSNPSSQPEYSHAVAEVHETTASSGLSLSISSLKSSSLHTIHSAAPDVYNISNSSSSATSNSRDKYSISSQSTPDDPSSLELSESLRIQTITNISSQHSSHSSTTTIRSQEANNDPSPITRSRVHLGSIAESIVSSDYSK